MDWNGRENWFNDDEANEVSGTRYSRREDTIPEVTDETRRRWREAATTHPYQGDDSGSGVTIEELLGDIDLALEGWRKEREE
jgi:hypothetical protein